MKRRPDPLLSCQPWKVYATWEPVEKILRRIEREGTIDVVGAMAVFKEDGRGWFDLVAALDGLIEFHRLARQRYGYPAGIEALERFGKKLHHGAPIFQTDIDAVRRDIAACKQQAMRLRQSQATDLIETVRVQMEVERLGLAGAAA